MDKQFTGKVGLKAIAEGWKIVLKLRWNIQPGDSITFDCTSGKPEQQFKAFQYWRRYHCDWLYDEKKLEFYWTRPPYPDDEIWKQNGIIIPRTPSNVLEPIEPDKYFDCFTFVPEE